MSFRTLTSCYKDQRLARLIPPRCGTPGRDVLGGDINVADPLPATIRVGSNVRVEDQEDGSTAYYATFDGRIRWADGVLAVDDVYVIKGNVGLETGNIDHPGAVVIEGDIQAGASVTAKGDIIVKGMVEPSNVNASGKLVVNGGVVGRDGFKIELDGGLHAKYVLEATVLTGDDVEVSNEIDRANIKTRGRVVIPKGRITGGHVSARRGIDVGVAGADGLIPTVLSTGFDFESEAGSDDVNTGPDSSRIDNEEIRVYKRIFPKTTLRIGNVSVTIGERIDLPRRFTVIDGQITGLPLDVKTS